MQDHAAPVRVAALCAGEHLERWQARCIEHLLSAEGVELVAIVLAEDVGPPGSTSARRIPRPRGRQLRDSVELSLVAPHVPQVRPDVAVHDLDLDFALALGVDPHSEQFLAAPRRGLWAFDFDREWTERIGLGEAWRVLRGEAVTRVALVRLTSAVDRVIVLREGWFKTDDRRPFDGLVRMREAVASWPALACADLRQGDSARTDGPEVASSAPQHAVPGRMETVRLTLVVLRNRLRVAVRRLFRHHQWSIGIVDQPIHAFLHATSDPPIRWFPLRGRRGFLADPFGLRSGDDATIVCEYFDYRKGRGAICRIEVSGGDFASAPQPVLELPVHMSYPCLVEDGGVLYCIPEVESTREVSLFRADPFPRRWTKVNTLVTDVSAIDPTVFRHEGRWWLTCIDGDGEADANLLVWHAPDLSGPWTPHAANPVKTDVRSARPAGTPFEHEGRLYRPSQDCSRTYGGRILVDRQSIALTYLRRHVPPAGRILDAGCGAGFASLELAESGYSVHGVDLTQEMIDQCERTFAQKGVSRDVYAFTRGDVMHLDLPPESFDGIVALGVLQYQVEEGPLLERFHSLLRRGGTLVVTGPVERSIPNLFGAAGLAGSALRRIRVLPDRPKTGRSLHRYSPARFRRLLHAAGFEVVEQKGHGFGDWTVIGGLIGYRGELALHRFFTWVARFAPVGRWGNDLVIAARRPAA